ncbi:hypothetical protein [Gordonia sp. CPCC 205333]|uniref:hypothetical protein n=1 Tax=Gordonia sp. CPCC 205333 TaxID=3140790 RepID=UPI003AF3DDB3
MSGIQEEDSRSVPGDLLAEWDVLFHSRIGGEHPAVGDLLARRRLRRARHSRTSILAEDSHPVVLLDTDIAEADAIMVWRQVTHAAEGGGTLSDVLLASNQRP